MKYRWDKKYLYWGITLFLVAISTIGFYYLLFHGANVGSVLSKITNILMPIIMGFALAFLLTPILNWVENKILLPLFQKTKTPITKKGRKRIRTYGIILTMLLVFFVLYAFFSMVIPQLIKSIQSIVLQFPVYVNNLTTWVGNILSNNPDIEVMVMDLLGKYSTKIEEWLNQSLLPQMNEVLKTLSLSLIGFLKSLWNLILGIIISIYVLGSKELFTGQSKKIVYALFSRKTANAFIKDVRFAHTTFIGFLGGKIIDSIIIGIICFIGTSIMGTPYALLVSVIIGVTNVIPFFGPYLGAIPSGILILMVDPIHCLYFAIFILILQQFDGNVLGPKILGDSTGLSSFWVIFSITLFGGIFGIFGMFIGVPTFAVIYAAVKAIFNRMLTKKGLTSDTNQYITLAHINDEEQYVDIVPEEKKRVLSSVLPKKPSQKSDKTDKSE